MLSDAQRGQGVGGLAGLGDGDEEGVRRHYMLAVAVLAGYLHMAGHAGEGLDPILGHKPSMVAGAAGDDGDGLSLSQHGLGLETEGLREHMLGGETALQGIGDGPRLLEDFLLHEVTVLAALGRVRSHRGLTHRALHHFAVTVPDGDTVEPQLRKVAFFQKDEPVGYRQQGEDIGGDEVLLEADADHQRAALAGGHEPAGVLRVDDTQRVSPLQPPGGPPHGLGEAMARS